MTHHIPKTLTPRPHCEEEGYPLQLVEELEPPSPLTDDAAMAASGAAKVMASAKRLDTRTGLAAQQRDAKIDPDNYVFLGWNPEGAGEVPM